MRLLLGLLLLLADLAPGKQPVTAADLLRIRRVTQVEVARDGSTAIFGVQSMFAEPDGKDDTKYGYRTHLYSIDLRDPKARPVQLTFGDRNDGAFALSPDGARLAFERRDSTKDKPQVWLLPVRGPGEARAVTTLEQGAGSPLWRPDGKALLVSSSIPYSRLEGTPHYASERPGRDWLDTDRPKEGAKIDARPDGDLRSIRNWLERNASRANPTVLTRIGFQGEQGLQGEPTVNHLFLIDLADGNKATQITTGFYDHNTPDFSPDGSRIAFVSFPPAPEHPDRLRRGALWLMNADGTQRRALLDDPTLTISAPQFLPDGTGLLIGVQETDELSFRQRALARVGLDGRTLERVTRSWDSAVNTFTPASDGGVLFTSNWHGGVPLQRVRRNSQDVTGVTSGPTGVTAFDEAAGRVVYALTSVPNPNELYVIDNGAPPRRLTDLNTHWLADRELSLPTERWLTRPDGTKVQYWVMNPIRVEAGRRYPWVLDMHGGPTAMWGPGEFSMWHEFQLFASFGYGVVYANPRGSSGYGYAFQKGNLKNWGEGPAGDVLAALDEALKATPLADPDRLFLTGGSYAGYLTAWIVSHDHRFRAAASQRGVYDLATFYGEGNAYRLVESYFGGFPWQPEVRRLLERESPLTYVADIRTPLLILHGSQDLRTGVSQSEMLYRSLKQLNRPVEYVRYPGIGHELTRSGPPLQRMDHLLRIVEFFERYNLPAGAAAQHQ